jgi:hypothetical protein
VASRRDALGAVGTATVVAVAGCAGLTEGDATRSTASPTTAPRFVVRLQGPSTDRQLFTGPDLATVGDVQQFEANQWGFSAQLSDAATERLSERFAAVGVADDPSRFQLQIRVDGKTRRELGVQSSFAEAVASEEYDGRFVFTFETEATATEVQTVADSG